MTDPEAVQKRADELRGECAGAPVFQWFARRELTREAKTQARPEDVAEVESVMRDAWIADRNGPGSAVAAMAIIARYGTPPLAAGSTNARNPTDRRLIIEKGGYRPSESGPAKPPTSRGLANDAYRPMTSGPKHPPAAVALGTGLTAEQEAVFAAALVWLKVPGTPGSANDLIDAIAAYRDSIAPALVDPVEVGLRAAANLGFAYNTHAVETAIRAALAAAEANNGN